MKSFYVLIGLFATCIAQAFAAVSIDEEAFGKSLGGWEKKANFAEYPLSGADYRTYKPETSPTPDGGLFISIRIDHVRGWLANNDHAMLEINVNAKGMIASAQSTIAIQGRNIASDVIVGGNEAAKAAFGTEKAIQIGADLISDLSAKLLRENIVEAGRVSFPAVLRHNYNRLFQAIRLDGATAIAPPPGGDPDPAKSDPAKPDPAKPEPAKPEPAKPDPAKPEPAKPEPVKPDSNIPAPTPPAAAPNSPLTPPVNPAAAPPAPVSPTPPGNNPLELKPY